MKKLILNTFLLLSLMFSACDEDCDGLFSGCDSGPFYGDLTVRVTINNQNPEVEVTIFRGKVEKGDTVIHEFINESSQVYSLEADTYYSGTVLYQDGIKEVLVINGRNLPTSSDDCDCTYATNRTLNLRLAK